MGESQLKNVLWTCVEIFVLILSDLFGLSVVAGERSIFASQKAEFTRVKDQTNVWEKDLEEDCNQNWYSNSKIPSWTILIIWPDK